MVAITNTYFPEIPNIVYYKSEKYLQHFRIILISIILC